jgi:hypothetical protein
MNQKQLIKKIKFWLHHIDGMWSVPLAFLVFWMTGLLLSGLFGYGTGTYDPGFIQPLFLATAIVAGATNAAIIGVYFTFRGIYKYLYGERKKDASWINYSKKDWLKLAVWQRILIGFGVFFYYVSAVLVVYLKLV